MKEEWDRLPQHDFLALLREKYTHLDPVRAFQVVAERSERRGPALPHGTTILAVRFDGGVLIGGDRQATTYTEIADRNIEKVFEMDEYSAIAIAGVAGPAIQMAQLLRTQFEYYEKVEGTPLSLEGKANYLAHVLRQNLPAALQGLVVVPIFAGYDPRRRRGRIFKYDVAGGRYEETDYYATGSGGKDARSTLKKRYHAGLSEEEAIRCAVEALLDASDEDVATGGFDWVRGIFPLVKVITQEGARDVPEERLGEIAEGFLNAWRADFAARRNATRSED
ncbi:MAG: proteasome subunit beta [Candidatus Poribacteria bacterium]|nr:MAG: proteasome subunit beta [Candidatus Poribacteria bacterium]